MAVAPEVQIQFYQATATIVPTLLIALTVSAKLTDDPHIEKQARAKAGRQKEAPAYGKIEPGLERIFILCLAFLFAVVGEALSLRRIAVGGASSNGITFVIVLLCVTMLVAMLFIILSFPWLDRNKKNSIWFFVYLVVLLIGSILITVL